MRKHFLILMLLTLLPFTAWAEDLTGNSGVIVAVADIEYGQAAFGDADIRVTLDGGEIDGTYWNVAGYYVDEACTEEVASLAALPVGATRYVKINFEGAYSGHAVGSFAVKKATIVVNIKASNAHAAFFTKSYLGTEPDALTAGDVIGTLRNADITEATYLNIDVAKLNQYTYNKEGSVAGSPYAITFPADAITLKDTENYELDIKDRSMTINPAVIDEADVLFKITPTDHFNAKSAAEAPANDIYMYKAAGLNPTYGITWNYKNTPATTDDYSLVEGTDFEVKFYDAETNEVTPTDAGNYTVKIFGMGNFTTPTDDHDNLDVEDDTPNAGVAMDPFNIAKRPVTIKAIPQDKSYDGELVSTLFENVGWNVNGLQGADQSLGVTGLRINPITEIDKNVAAYVTTVAWNEVEAQDAQEAQEESYVEAEGVTADTFDDLKANLYVEVYDEAVAFEEGTQYYSYDGAEYNQEEIADAAAYDAFVGDLFVQAYEAVDGNADFDGGTTYYTHIAAQEAQDAVEYQPAATVGEKLLTANYAPTARTSTWNITKKDLTVTIANKEMKKSDDDLPNVTTGITITAKSGFVVDEKNAIEDAFNTAYAATAAHGVPGDVDYVPAEIMYDVTIDNIEIKTYEGAIKATPKDGGDGAVLANYNIAYEGGNLIVKGADFNLDPIVKSVMEYGDEYSITFDAYDEETAATLNPATPVRYKINGTEITNVTQLPKDLGTYVVEIIAGDYGSGNYKSGTITYGSASYVINPKKLTLTVNAQTVHTNDPVTVITGMEAVKGAEGTYTLDKNTVNDEALTMTFSLDETKVKIEGGKITGWKDGAEDHNAIIATIGETAIDAHYNVTVVAGELNISNEFFADLAAATAATTIAEADANGSEYNVTISGRKLNADTWNVMVLPFAVKPLDFCKAIDQYAVFNTLKSAENGNVKFGLCYDEIPANQPFLVKTKTAVDFDETYDDDENEETPEVKKYVIEGVTFVNAEPKQTNVSGAIFKGTYAATYAIPEPSYYAMQGGVFKHFTESLPLGFTRAYIVLTDATEARFFVEEADGTVTAISSINADGVAVPAEGWYTLNGVKLQAAPVEKGVYINNGKKVVIK